MERCQIENLQISSLSDVRPLVESCEYKPYHHYTWIENTQLSDFVIEELKTHIQSNHNLGAYLAHVQGKVVGLGTLRFLPWDTQIFSKKMAMTQHLIATGTYEERAGILNALVKKLIERAHDAGVKHLAIKADTADTSCIHSVGGQDFKLMDVLVVYSFDFSKSQLGEMKYSLKIRGQEEGDVESVVDVSRSSFHNYIDRFHSDPTLDDQQCDTLYAEWARNSCLRLVADYVTVAEDDGEVVGFATSKMHKGINEFIDRKLGEIVLVCVSPKARGGGLYTSFIHQGLEQFRGKADVVQVVTQINNIAVQRAWSNLGFRLIGSRCTFHKWIQ